MKSKKCFRKSVVTTEIYVIYSGRNLYSSLLKKQMARQTYGWTIHM